MMSDRSENTHAISIPLSLWYFSGLQVVLGCVLTTALRTPNSNVAEKNQASVLQKLLQSDGTHYQNIATTGYDYDAGSRSSVAFFPAYPIISRLLLLLLNFDASVCMLLVSNLFLLVAFFLFNPVALVPRPNCVVQDSFQWAAVSFALWPATFFFRMPYAESMLCFFILLALHGVARQWPIVWLALIAGAASGTRPVGIAVSMALVWFVVVRKPKGVESRFSLKSKLLSLLWLVPLSCWGLIAYSLFLWWKFDAPLAFAQTQEHWTFPTPVHGTFWDKTWSLIRLEPIWGVYDPDSYRFWARGDTQNNPLFSCLFWNPIFYLFSWFLIILGWRTRWLTGPEIVLSLGLLLIPYVTRAYEMSMASHARFAAVVIPQYFVLGRLFAMMPPAIAGCVCGLMGLMLGLWTALFVAGYRFF